MCATCGLMVLPDHPHRTLPDCVAALSQELAAADRLRRHRRRVRRALLPDAANGLDVVVGRRSRRWAPCVDVAAPAA